MKDLDPFDASVLNVLARVPDSMSHLRGELLDRLKSDEGREIARAILAEDVAEAEVSEDAQVTAVSFRRAAGVR